MKSNERLPPDLSYVITELSNAIVNSPREVYVLELLQAYTLQLLDVMRVSIPVKESLDEPVTK
jgi:hypothetical protein